ncbi:MAG: hypothetical protein HQL01_02300 [Nitrospirae bacterium]|nr:hypothetical protein [Nitrospirota bacterium]
MARLYKDYISVDEHFFPVFSKNLDTKYPDHWKAFVPHDTFKNILKDLAGSLEMAVNQSRRSLWISGAYGTGKTYASFAIKHILEDDIGDVAGYFQKQGIDQTTLTRFTSLKQKGTTLVVHRSSSAGITGDNRLFSAIQESIKKALKEKGYTYYGGKSLYTSILDILKTPDSSFNFAGAFKRYKEKFTEYATPDEVIKDLGELDTDGSLDLLQRIIEVADSEHFSYSHGADDVIAWIEDIIKGNNLYAIVFIWDEFTEFFKNNQTALTGLQELAQASFTMPFYFLLITHLTHSQLISDSDSMKKIKDRFKIQTIEMPDKTAFMLIRTAIQTAPDLTDEWRIISNDLWSKVERMVSSTIPQDIKKDELRGILPLHPYAAYMLKVISAVISSNQRTMFQFLCGDTGQGAQGRRNFRWYIENHSIDDWHYLTSDYIWDYFLNYDNPDLDEATRNTISHYDTFENQCDNEDDKRALKTVLLLYAMQQKRGGITGRGFSNLLRPALSNISAAFEGTAIYDKLRIIMDKLVKKGVLGSIPDRNDILYVTQSRTIDEERLNLIREKTLKDNPFKTIVLAFGINSRYELSGYLKTRCVAVPATSEDIRRKLYDAAGKLPPNKICIVFVYAKQDEDSLKNHDIITKLLQEYTGDAVIADMSSQPLGQQSYNNYIDLKTKSEYFSTTDHNQVRLYDANAKGIIEEWIQKLDVTAVSLYTKGEMPVQVKGPANFRLKIKEINARLYPNGLETVSDMDKLFSEDGFRATAAVMGMDKLAIASNYKYLDAIKIKLMNENLWHSHNYETTNSSHPVSKMKAAIEELIKSEFDKNNSVMVTDIWRIMQARPFGLMNCAGTVFLLGFLLKEYADSRFYRNDETNTVALTHDGLADIIFDFVKGLSKNRNIRIVRMTPEHEIFCSVTAEVFTIREKNSIQDILHGLKTHASNINFPLWAIKEYVADKDTSGLGGTITHIVDLLCEFVSSERHAGRDVTKIAEDIARLYQKDAVIKDYLRDAATTDNLKIGMDIYIGRQRPELKAIAGKLGIADMGYIKDLKAKLSPDASWLWDVGDIDRKIGELYEDYKLIDSINGILTAPVSTMEDAAHGIKGKIGAFKMPFEFFKDSCKEINPLFFYLIDTYKTDSLKNTNRAALINELEQNADSFNKFCDNQYQAFCHKVGIVLNEPLSDEECSHIYKKMESNSIAIPIDQYIQDIKQHYSQLRKSKNYGLLVNKWKELTDTDTPKTWSQSRRIPVLCMFENEFNEAVRVFSIINKSADSASNEQIDAAIRFLENSENIGKLNNIDLCDKIFRRFISGEYEILFTGANINSLKDALQNELGSNVYDWYLLKAKTDAIVKKFAHKKYVDSYYPVVFQTIDTLCADDAKAYLKELIKNEPLVGIRIMKTTKDAK